AGELISELYAGNVAIGLNQSLSIIINESILLQEFCLLRIIVELPDYCVCASINFSLGLEEWIGNSDTILVCNNSATPLENALDNFCTFELPDHPSFSFEDGRLIYLNIL